MNARRFDESLEVLVDMEKRHSKNEKILKNIAVISLNNYDQDTALETYIKLIKINSSSKGDCLSIMSFKNGFSLSKIYLAENLYSLFGLSIIFLPPDFLILQQ